MTEQHETKEVDVKIKQLRAIAEKLQPTMPFKVTVERVLDDAQFDSEVWCKPKILSAWVCLYCCTSFQEHCGEALG